jgi:hypothetical protein
MRPMRRLLPLGALLMVMGALYLPQAPAPAQGATNCQTFAQTQHNICGAFLTYWQNHGGLAQQGYPLTEELTAVSDLDGKSYRMQVFERAVFEAHPENPAPNDILLSQLGTARYKQKYASGAPNGVSAPGGIWFEQTGHSIGGKFLAYWRSHGGLAQQGYPISEEFQEQSDLNGKTYTVQYFERAVFEYHPENAPPNDVLLAQLGALKLRAQQVRQTPAAQQPGQGPPSAASRSFQKGVNYASWYTGQYSSAASDQSLANLAATGANSLTVVVTGYQDTVASTQIARDPARTPSDADLAHVIARAHQLGMKVMLKPHVDLANDPGHWRGQIGSAFSGEDQWQGWFSSYHAFIDHYADLAQQTGADLFCAGTELVGTSARAADWRAVLADIRARFKGPVTYASNWGGDEVSIRWWDALDYIGVDAYYPLTDKSDPTVAELQQTWINKGYVTTLEGLAQTWQKPILLTEIGYGSVAGNNRAPYDWQANAALDLQEQANAYQAVFSVFWGKPWLAGMYWWSWSTDPNAGGAADPGYTPHNKPAEQILRSYYAGTP